MDIGQIPLWVNVLSLMGAPLVALGGVVLWLYRKDRQKMEESHDKLADEVGLLKANKADNAYVLQVETRILNAIQDWRKTHDHKINMVLGELRRND